MYNYTTERPKIFTEEGIHTLIKIRDKVRNICSTAGACTVGKAMVDGDSFLNLACIDFLVGRGDLSWMPGDMSGVATQDRVLLWRGQG